MARYKKLIKTWLFEERNRSGLTLDADIRLHRGESSLQLLPDSTTDKYPTDADIKAITWIANPLSAREWLGFQAEIIHVSVDGEVVTSAGYRLHDGTDQYWWNGAAWEVNTTDWNTEGEVATNIGSFRSLRAKSASWSTS